MVKMTMFLLLVVIEINEVFNVVVRADIFNILENILVTVDWARVVLSLIKRAM